MKCPKCSYLGFETGDRCKNCGYDFSLLAVQPESPDPDLNLLQVPDEMPAAADHSWMDRLHTRGEEVTEAHEMPEPALGGPSSTLTIEPPIAARDEAAFPLFAPRDDEDDEPLIKLPAAPRAPLSVRRTPEQPRLPEQPRIRPPGRPSPSDEPPLSLQFADEPLATSQRALRASREPFELIDPVEPIESSDARARLDTHTDISSLPRRVAAGLTDHAILFSIDLIVLYSTVRMAGLTMGDWQLLPPVPMLAFLLLLKLSYFGAFTAACGQTIGKMAAHIRVVSDDAPLDPGRAIRRTIVSAISLLAFGTGFIPALIDPEHRALHDRIARTRVVELL